MAVMLSVFLLTGSIPGTAAEENTEEIEMSDASETDYTEAADGSTEEDTSAGNTENTDDTQQNTDGNTEEKSQEEPEQEADCADDTADQTEILEQTEDDLTGGTYETQVFNMYAKLRGFHLTSGNTALAIHGMRSEDAEKGSTLSDGAATGKMFDDFEYLASNGMIKSYWNDNYSLIHKVNDLLDEMSQNPSLTEGDLVNKGEALFVRAFCYFNLVRAFGEVPLIDFKVYDAAEANVPKSSVAKIYELIDSDLTEAENSLPRTWEQLYVGRLTWGAARSLHARTYMMRNDWGNMKAAAEEVINSGLYNLKTPYEDIFREKGENCSESVFELQCTATESQPGSNDIGSQFASVQGVRGAGEWNLGWGQHTATQELADAFEEGDPRKDETLLYFIRNGKDDPESIPANKPYGEKPISNADVIAKYFNKKAYTDPAMRLKFTKGGYWVNIRLIRYADVVLMASEAACELGDLSSARNYLEMVRARARGNNIGILPEVTTNNQNELREAIRHERRVELGMEFDRFYDLVRWGIAKEVLHAAGKTGYQDRHALLPIPQDEIDKSNGVLVQNPNY